MESRLTMRLQHGDAEVIVCPDLGGTIARFDWREYAILRPASDVAIHAGAVRQMACYPLLPYSNRIGQAQLLIGGERYRLRANSPPESHALHGFGWQRAWDVVSHCADAIELSLQHTPDVDWPFACEAVQSIRLTDAALHMKLLVRNTDEYVMPAGLGFHPFFPIDPETALQTSWKKMWNMGADMLPTELVDAPAATDFSQSRPIDGWKVDNCFTGWNRRAILDYPTHRVQLEAGDACKYIVCFAPHDGRNFIALEPVTNINNAFALAAQGIGDTGTRLLALGDALEISMTIAVSKP